MQEIEEIPKKPRGRPKGTTKPKKPPPEKPEKPEKPPSEKPKKKYKPKTKVVQYECESDEELPHYVHMPRQQRDLATQMMDILQQHNMKKNDARKQMYNSWFSRF